MKEEIHRNAFLQKCLCLYDKRMKKTTSNMNKKAQEETFGFLIIVALIMVVGMLFLLLQKPEQSTLENKQISNLLYSIESCTSSYQDKQIREVIEDCYNGNDDACETAKQEMEEMLDIALKEGNFIVGSQLKGCSLNVSNSEELFFIKKGEISGNMIGSVDIIHASPEDVVVKLKFYY